MIFFLTGTDTGIGKTTAAIELLNDYQQQGFSTLALKPVASGGMETSDGFRNDDALLLQTHSSIHIPYDEINPWLFHEPIAPHIAAMKENKKVTVPSIAQHCQTIAARYQPDVLLIEGVGGFCVPLNDHELYSAVPALLDCSVILVVGMRLGCLNHAILTAAAIEKSGCIFEGWIANRCDPAFLVCDDNIETLKHLLPGPCLREVLFKSYKNV